MRSKRVGTISMAIVLIGLGLTMFIAQISKISAIELAIKFWPLVLILLGGEILWYSVQAKKEKEEIKIRYDVFSVFIVMVILFTNIVIYGLMETGVLDYIKVVVAEETHRYEQKINY